MLYCNTFMSRTVLDLFVMQSRAKPRNVLDVLFYANAYIMCEIKPLILSLKKKFYHLRNRSKMRLMLLNHKLTNLS